MASVLDCLWNACGALNPNICFEQIAGGFVYLPFDKSLDYVVS